jgi:hypothetical protein
MAEKPEARAPLGPESTNEASVEITGAGVLVPKWGYTVLGAMLLASILPLVAFVIATGVYAMLMFAVHALLFGSMALTYGMRSIGGAKVVEGTLRSTSNGLALDGRLLASRGTLTQGFVLPSPEGTLVRFDRVGAKPPLFVRVPDHDAAHTLLATLGFDAGKTAAHLRIASGLLALSGVQQAAAIAAPLALLLPSIFSTTHFMGRAAGPYVFAEVLVYVAYVLGLAFAPTTVNIGTDGVEVRWLHTSRFVRLDQVARVERFREFRSSKEQHGVRLHLRDGDVVRLHTGQGDLGLSDAARLESRLDDARSAGTSGQSEDASRVGSLQRGTSALPDWVRSLRRLGAGVVDHRHAAVPRDRLLQVVEDGTASREERAYAAVALVSSDDPEARERVRVAAEATVEPRLRVALQRIDEVSREELPEDAIEGELSRVLRTLERD